MLGDEGIQVVGGAATGEDGVALVRHAKPDVVLMDMHLGDLSGVEATRRIRQVAPDTHVIVLTVSTESDDVLEALVAGAAGYLTKGATMVEIVDAIVAVAGGRSPLSPEVAGHVLGRLREYARHDPPPGTEGPALSGRELEVLRLVGEGLDNMAIAARLKIGRA